MHFVCMLFLGLQQGIFSGQQQQQQQQQLNNLAQMANAMAMPLVFGDSRDFTIKKFNQLQAFFGHGKGIVNPTQSVDFSQENPHCRFKVCDIRYICHPIYQMLASLHVLIPAIRGNNILSHHHILCLHLSPPIFVSGKEKLIVFLLTSVVIVKGNNIHYRMS